jgi:hypothetical protein
VASPPAPTRAENALERKGDADPRVTVVLETEPPRAWQFAVRAFVGPAFYLDLGSCFFHCEDGGAGDYLFEGGSFTASLGRPKAHIRWQLDLDVLHGSEQTNTFGVKVDDIYAARAITGFRLLSNPGASPSVVFELNGGLSYYLVEGSDFSPPMLGGTMRIGADVDSIEVLAAASFDTILRATAASATVSLGYKFDN